MAYILEIIQFILGGLTITLKLYLVTAIFSVPLGIICALGKISDLKLLKKFLGIYTWIFRGTPLLLQLFFIYYGLPIVVKSITFTPFVAASITFTINYSAYLTEIFRAGIESIYKGQYEAAHALGLNYRQTMIHIIIPQAIRRVIPPVCNEAITLVKDTALVVTIGMGDLLRASKEIVTRDFTITPFIIAAIFYLLISSLIVTAFNKLEEKYYISE